MFNIDGKDFKQFEENLKNTHKYAVPDTVRKTLTTLAYKAHAEYKKNVSKNLVLRGGKNNNIVTKSIHWEKAQYKEKNIDNMYSLVGQLNTFYGKETDQLRKQEFGETLVAKSKHITKATKYTRGGSYRKLVPKDKLIAKTNVKRIKDLVKYPATGTTMQFKQAIAVAHRQHKTINFLPETETSGHKFGIFQFWDSGTKYDKNGKPHAKGKAAKLLYSFKDKTQKLEAKPMLSLASYKVGIQSKEIFKKEAERRIAKEMSKKLKK